MDSSNSQNNQSIAHYAAIKTAIANNEEQRLKELLAGQNMALEIQDEVLNRTGSNKTSSKPRRGSSA